MPKTNRIFLPLVLLLLGVGTACRDGPVDPAGQQLTLELRRGDVPFEEETIAPGATFQLNARLVNAAGTEQNASGLNWSSTDVSVATVDGSGRVTGIDRGSTRIIVSAGERADTGIVNVARPVDGDLSCAPGDEVLELAVGAVRVLRGEEAVHFCLPGEVGDGSDYLLVPFNASSSVAARLFTEVTTSGSTAASTSRAPARTVSPERPRAREPLPDRTFHERHLERSRLQFEPALRRTASAPRVTARATPEIGTLMRLNAATLSGDGCSDPDYRTGRVMVVSRKAVIVADTSNPAGGFTTEDYESIAETFDDLIWDVNVENFGEPTDIDENGRVIIFYTRAVNELTPAGADSYVGGFFYNRDLFSRSGSNSCSASNEAEMFYMLVPDPAGEVNGNARAKSFVHSRTYSVLAHEFQHLINDSRRLYVNRAPVWEENWLNEGLSHIAEELAFYAASDFEPRQNLGSSPLVGAGSGPFLRYNVDNAERYLRYLQEPEENSVMGAVENLGTRGASWSFLRYVADRDPGDDDGLWMRLTNSTTRGLDNLEEVLGANPREWMRDWQISVFTDDAIPQIDAEYTQPSWNFRLLSRILDPDPSGRFALRTRWIDGGSAPMLLDGGAAAFLRMRVEPGARRAVRTTVNDLPPPSRLEIAVVRLP